ncbi:MAG TPA: glycosyltransferase [Candidatus Sulfotelmatobacter sp.]|nr:glycosyltransferase [Candidatus Sulfotelmatobacter sp.]
MIPTEDEVSRSVEGDVPTAGNANAMPGPAPTNIFLMIDSLQTGGSERQFVALSRALDRKQFRVSLGCIQAKGAFLNGMDVESFRLGGSLYGFQSWKTRMRLSRRLREQQIAIAHSFDFYTNLTLGPAARLAGVPAVIGSQRQLGDLLTPMQARAQAMMFRWCDAVVCNSDAASKRLIAQGLPERKIAVIRNGLAPEGFAPAAPALPRRPGCVRVGMIARMNSASKNHSLLLRAAARIKARASQVEFVLVGDGPLRPNLEREAASLGLGDCVHFLGDRHDIPAILASLDVTALPSESESLSNAVIESMAAGVPVVASLVGGNPELLSEERGTLVPAGDESSLAEAILRLVENEAMRIQMGQSCRRFALEHFTIEKMRQQHERLYRRLLAGKEIRPTE